MKFKVTLKDPDCLLDAIDEAVDENMNQTIKNTLTPHEYKMVKESRVEEINKICKQWFEYGEYLEVEIDTEAKTCTVLNIKC
jgi:hypothetical protein